MLGSNGVQGADCLLRACESGAICWWEAAWPGVPGGGMLAALSLTCCCHCCRHGLHSNAIPPCPGCHAASASRPLLSLCSWWPAQRQCWPRCRRTAGCLPALTCPPTSTRHVPHCSRGGVVLPGGCQKGGGERKGISLIPDALAGLRISRGFMYCAYGRELMAGGSWPGTPGRGSRAHASGLRLGIPAHCCHCPPCLLPHRPLWAAA
jgi:hypothetical protein